MKLLRLPICAALVMALVPAPAMAEREGRDDMTVLGYVEDVHVGKLGLEMKGKLDTGADSSSVYGRDVKVYKKSGKDDDGSLPNHPIVCEARKQLLEMFENEVGA